MLALFGVPPIEELQSAGAQGCRAFFVDGNGRDLVTITFMRMPDSEPMLSVHFPRQGEQPAVAPATTLVPSAAWERVLSASLHFDRALADDQGNEEASSVPGTITVCLHSWVYTIEAVDPGIRGGTSRLGREVEDSCENGLAEPYASELAKIALPLLPYCAALDPEQHRNTAALLYACRLLEGDRLAAAHGLNLVSRLDSLEAGDQAVVSPVFDYTATLIWDGQRFDGSGAAARAWLQQGTVGGVSHLFVDR